MIPHGYAASASAANGSPGVIDHLIYASPDLDAAVTDLEGLLGVRAERGGQHPGLGTHNALLALGPRTYLEIIAPDPRQARPSMPRPFGVDGMTHPGLAAWALGCEDIDERVAHARRHGYEPGQVMDGQRTGPAGEVLRWRMTGNGMAGGVIPFLITWGATDHPAGSAPFGLTLGSFHIEHPDPPAIAPVLAALRAGVEVRKAATPSLVARISTPAGARVLRS